MAEVKVIEVQIKSNIDGATTSVSKFKAGLKDATTQSKELGSTLQGDKQSEFINKLGDGIGKLNPAFGSAVKGANGLLLKMWELVANPVGAILAGIVVTAKFLYEAFQSSVSGGKELKAIFAGISAVGEQVKDAMFGLGRALIGVTTAAYKFITLDFKGAAESMKEANREASNSYKQLGNAVDGTTAKIIYNLTKQQQANDKAKKIQDLTQSETNKLLVQSREILTDETASINEKKKALAEVTKAEKASSAEKTRIAAEDLRIIKERAKALGGEAEKKMKGEIREATIALNVAETENAMTGIKLNKQKKMLGREEAADVKEKNDAIAASNKEVADKRKAQLKIEEDERKRIAKENLDSMMASAKEVSDKEKALRESKETPAQKEEREYQEWLVKYQANNLNTELLDQQHKDNLALIAKTDAEKKAAEQKVIDDKILADAKEQADKELALEQAIKEAKRNALDTSLNILQQFAGKNKAVALGILAVQKGLAIADIVVNAAKSIGGQAAGYALADANALATLGPVAGSAFVLKNKVLLAKGIATTKIGAATSIASILAAGISGAKSITGGGGGATDGSGGGGGTAPAAPAFNVVGASPTNQLAQTIGNQQQQPIKTYVLANDVTTAQGLERNIISSASIG